MEILYDFDVIALEHQMKLSSMNFFELPALKLTYTSEHVNVKGVTISVFLGLMTSIKNFFFVLW